MAKKRIGIISNNNGWGLSKDIEIIQAILNNKYFETEFRHFKSKDAPKKYDLQIHNELIDGRQLGYSKYNVLVPNPEWCFELRSIGRRQRFVATLCKTKHAVHIFKKLGMRNVIYTGFTTKSKYINTIPRIPEFLHIAGGSRLKNTDRVIEIWNNYKLPKLHLYNSYGDLSHKIKTDNIEYHSGKQEDISKIQNRYLYHIQPSMSEGFGHIIWETLSCGNILITLDAPPMNELYSYKIPAFPIQQHALGMLYGFEIEDGYSTILEVLNISEKERNGRQLQSRQQFLSNNIQFREKFYTTIKDIIHGKYQ